LSAIELTQAEPAPPDALWAALAQLIDQADRALDRDRSTTRAYLTRAAALVQSERGRGASALSGAQFTTRMHKLAAYIDEHLAGPISTADLTAIAQMSTGHFFRVFKRCYGEAPFAFVTRRRVSKAQQLMLTTDDRLCEIALACGLCDQSHLTRVFRRWVGESPAAWRRRMTDGARVPS